MVNAVKSPLDYIVTADPVDQNSQAGIAQSIEDNLDRLFSAVNAFDVIENGGYRYVSTPFGIGMVFGTFAVPGATATLNINPFFNSILNVQVTQDGTTPGDVGFTITDSDTVVLRRASGSTTLHWVILGTIDPLVV